MPGYEEYYPAWMLLCILWRGMWNRSLIDWSGYRRRGWEIFASRIRRAVRTGRGLVGLLAEAARGLGLADVGSNADERKAVAALLALPLKQQRALLYQLRNDLPVLMMLLRLYRDQVREEREQLELPLDDDREDVNETAND